MPSPIGTVGPSRRSVQPATPSVSEAAFGAGIGQALGQVAQSYATSAQLAQGEAEANQAVSLAWKARNDKMTLANLNVEFLQLQNQLSLELAEGVKTAPPGAQGLTNAAEKRVNEAFTEFQRKIPERMLPSFLDRITSTKLALINSAFSAEVAAGDLEFKRGNTLFTQDAISKIMTAPTTSRADLEALAAQLAEDADEFYKGSPLSTVESRALREELQVAIDTALFARLAQDEAQNLSSTGGEVPGVLENSNPSVGPVRSARPVAAGLPGYAVGFLTVVGRGESSGEYNVMYSPEGRRYFSDFSKHPNLPATIPDGPHQGELSSASGKYGIIISTWNKAAQALGLKDFSPESQDRAAWWIAQQDYAKRTGGRSLDAALASGNPVMILEAKRVLGSTYEALTKIGDEEFLQAVLAGTGNPSSLLYSEGFSSIPYDQKVAILGDAQSQAAQIQQKIQADAAQRQALAIEEFKRSIPTGAGMAQLNQLMTDQNLSYDQYTSLMELVKKQDEQGYDAAAFTNKLQDPGYQVYSADDKKQSAAFFAQANVSERLAQMDQEFVQGALLPVIQQTQYIPSNVVTALASQASSSNITAATFALDTMNQLRGVVGPEFQRAFDDKTEANVALFDVTKGNLPMETVLGYIRGQNDPAMKAIIDARRDAIKENVKLDPEIFTPQGLIAEMGFEGVADPIVAGKMSAEFYPLYEYLFSGSGDHDLAVEKTIEILKKRYGDFSFNGRTNFMKYPPTLTAPAFKGSHEYLQEQLNETFNFGPEDNIAIISDGQTEAEFLAGKPASYKLARLDDMGLLIGYLRRKDTKGYDPREDAAVANNLVRWYPEITDTMIQQAADDAMMKGEIQNLRTGLLTFINPETGEWTTEEWRREARKKLSVLESRVGRKPNAFADPKLFAPIISGLGPVEGKDARRIVAELQRFRPKSNEEALAKIQELRGQMDTIYPIFQRWEIIHRLNELQKRVE